MDAKLRKRLEKIEDQIKVLYETEERFLTIEAAEENFKANLIAKAPGSSQAARETNAEATEAWKEFSNNLAIARAAFHRERHLLDLKNSAFQAEYLSYKLENETIKKQVG